MNDPAPEKAPIELIALFLGFLVFWVWCGVAKWRKLVRVKTYPDYAGFAERNELGYLLVSIVFGPVGWVLDMFSGPPVPTKQCPFCRGIIERAASVCWRCHRDQPPW